LQKAIDYFRRAINVDADHYLSYVGLADCYYRLSNIYLPPAEAVPKARSAVLKALAINEHGAEARALLALIRTFYDHDWPAAEDEFLRAIELAPNSPLPHRRYGWALGMIGRFNQGISEIDRALVLEPRSPVSQVGSGIVHYLARDYDEAITRAKRALDLEPEFFPARVLLGMVLFQQDRFTEGLSEVKKAASLASVPWTLGYLGYGYGISGKRREALGVLTRLQRTPRQIYVSPFVITLVLKGVGHSAEALRSLLKTYKDRNELIGFALGSPELDDLRSDPRFAMMLQRSNFPATHPAFIGARIQ
jgi:serine/threonine-protein kinase